MNGMDENGETLLYSELYRDGGARLRTGVRSLPHYVRFVQAMLDYHDVTEETLLSLQRVTHALQDCRLHVCYSDPNPEDVSKVPALTYAQLFVFLNEQIFPLFASMVSLDLEGYHTPRNCAAEGAIDAHFLLHPQLLQCQHVRLNISHRFSWSMLHSVLVSCDELIFNTDDIFGWLHREIPQEWDHRALVITLQLLDIDLTPILRLVEACKDVREGIKYMCS
jgi:hypothetical protein